MEYIIHKDFNEKAICGDVNLPRGTVCNEKGGVIYYGEKPLCLRRSENAYQFFSPNSDGRGLERGDLITAIKTAYETEDEHSYERRYRLWNDEVCNRLSRSGDIWLWNFGFYHAAIADLEHVLEIITDENWVGLIPPAAEEGEDA